MVLPKVNDVEVPFVELEPNTKGDDVAADELLDPKGKVVDVAEELFVEFEPNTKVDGVAVAVLLDPKTKGVDAVAGELLVVS